MRYTEHRQPEIGDILLCKSFSPIGWAIGNSFRTASRLKWVSGPRPSNHNGVIGVDKNFQMCVFESVSEGFVATPYYDYLADIDRQKCEIKIGRFGLSAEEKSTGNRWLQDQLGRGYDYRAYWSLIWRVALRLPPLALVQDNARFYCSEAVGEFFRELDHIILPKLCTPLHIESLVDRGYLAIIAECE